MQENPAQILSSMTRTLDGSSAIKTEAVFPIQMCSRRQTSIFCLSLVVTTAIDLFVSYGDGLQWPCAWLPMWFSISRQSPSQTPERGLAVLWDNTHGQSAACNFNLQILGPSFPCWAFVTSVFSPFSSNHSRQSGLRCPG